jgi:hypothetical protein
MQINCPNCGQTFVAGVESIVDGGRDPASKARLLSRRLNVAQCPHCQVAIQMTLPLVYHDHTKELMLVYIPMELNIPTTERERMVGEMTRAIMNSLPNEQRKGYLLNPIQPLTFDGMIDLILEKDGITKEMRMAQQAKLRLIERFLEAPPDNLEDLAAQHDDELDDQFFQLMTYSAESALQTGQREVAEAILARRDMILGFSSYGQAAMQRLQHQEEVVHEVADRIRQLGERMELPVFIDFVLEMGESEEHLQALAGLTRHAMNYTFFAELTRRAEEESDPQYRGYIEQVRDQLLEYTQAIDAQQQALVQQAQGVLQALMSAPDIDAAIQQYLPMIDNLVLTILTNTIQHFEQRGDLVGAARLRQLYEKITEAVGKVLVDQAQSVLQTLITAPDMDAAIQQYLPMIDNVTLTVLANTIQAYQERGDEHEAAHLQELYDRIREAIHQASPPEVQFINALLNIEDEIEARLTLSEHAAEFGRPLLDYMDAFIERLSGNSNQVMILDRLRHLRQAAAQIIEKQH